MSSETEIAVRDGNFFVIENELSEPRNKGQKELLKYMHTQIRLGNKADELEMRKIFFKYSSAQKGQWEQIYSFSETKWEYDSVELCKAHHPEYRVMGDYWGKYVPCKWRDYTIEDYYVKSGATSWLIRSIGSLVKNGFLIVIPKGYILQRIEESKKEDVK